MQLASPSPAANPFLLMLDPQRVLRDMERSPALRSLSQRKCHPLDRPVLRAISVELRQVDEAIDREVLADELGDARAGSPAQ